MGSGSTRKGVSQAKFNEDASNFIFGEITILSVVIGLYFSSWYIFGIILIGLIISMFVPVIRFFTGIIISIFSAVISAVVICFLQDIDIPDPYNFLTFLNSVFDNPASKVVGGIIFIISLGLHFATLEWTRDVTDSEDRNY